MECIQDLFRGWGIPPDITHAFIENGVSVELLPKLSTENFKELCPHTKNKTRIHLQEKITEFITAYAPTESNITSITTKNSEESNSNTIFNINDISISQLVLITTQTKSFPNFDLQILLKTTAGGNSILKYYETNGFLNSNKRNQLTDIIVKHIYTHIINCRITYEDYNTLAAKIITLFPKESVGTYFTHPIKKRDSLNRRSTTARGKLVDKVRNLIYKYGDRKRGISSSDSENVPPSKAQRLDLQANSDVIWLKQNSEPWDEVLQRWKNTFDIRKETKLPAQIDILGCLVPPRGRLSKRIKCTTQEAIESIFILAKSAGDIDAIIVEQREKARVKKLPVQPYMILQGYLLSCSSPLLIIDDVRYGFISIRNAFDILFKSYHVLARYPRAGDYLYLIIQRCVYKIQTKYDNVVSYISDILNICD